MILIGTILIAVYLFAGLTIALIAINRGTEIGRSYSDLEALVIILTWPRIGFKMMS